VRELARLARSPRSRRQGRAFIEGLRAVGAAIDAARAICLVVTPEAHLSPYARRIPGEHPDLPVVRVTADAFRTMSRRQNPSGMGAVIVERWWGLDSLEPEPDRYWVAVSRSDYPGNLGCVIRSAVANGASGLMLLEGRGDPYHPEALRAAVGAIFATRMVRCSADDLAEWGERYQVTIVGVDPEGSQECHGYDFARPLVLLLGAERTGIADEHRRLCRSLLRIPMSPGVDSLNVCAAASIVTYEAQRRHLSRRR
jgi:TrmH family RNA methyltransferase